MTFNNTTGRLILVTDVRIGGQSIFPSICAQLRSEGRLEDEDDAITLFPNEALTLTGADTVVWVES